MTLESRDAIKCSARKNIFSIDVRTIKPGLEGKICGAVKAGFIEVEGVIPTDRYTANDAVILDIEIEGAHH